MLYLINLDKVGIAGMSRGISTGDNNTIFFDNPSSFYAIFFAVFKIRAYRLHKRQAL